MENKVNFEKKFANAAKWSTLTQVIAKLIAPITNMVLARLLTPEAFGVIATITMIISFVEMFTDSGFQNYLIQHEFKDLKRKFESANVAFWTNLFLSFFIWGIILIFNEKIATIVGNPGLGIVIVVACAQLPLTSLSSIQMALYRRDLDFKTLFVVRIIGVLIPFVVTIPLAFIGFSYWSLIIGTICMHLFNAIVLTYRSKWKPQFYYSFKILKEMLSFSIWSLIESFSIWLTAWVDTFIITSFINQHYLGLYKTSTTMVNALMSLITASIVPVLFSVLSRLQNDDNAFKKMFYRNQRIVAYLVLPMGFGLFLYSDVATQIMLGSQWSEASDIIGIWALTSCLMIVTSHFNSEVYRAKGKPKLSFFAQTIALLFLIPTCLISVQFGFWSLVYARALIRFQGIITGFIIMKYLMGFQIMQTLKNISKPIIFTLLMSLLGLILKQFSSNLIFSFSSIIICASFYFLLIYKFAKKDLYLIKNTIKR